MTEISDGVVLVGRRSAAIQIACRLYPRVVQVSQGLKRMVAGSNLVTIEPQITDAESAAAIATEIRNSINPLAVVALTEASVVTAAQIRVALGLPGLDMTAAERCTDKVSMKQVIRDAGIACARYVTAEERLSREQIVMQLGLPLVLKTQRGSGGRGARVIDDIADMPVRLSDNWMAESFVRGTEMSVESFVVDGNVRFVNFTQYFEPRWANIVPARADTLPVEALLDMNQRVISALNIERGITHMEVFLTDAGPAFGEIAARPPGGYIMELMRLAYDFDPWDAVFEIEAGQVPQLPATPLRCAGVRLVHPGPGRVSAVRGRDELAAAPGLVKLHTPLRPGQLVSERVGTGQACGYALFAGDRADVEAGLEALRTRLIIDIEPITSSI